MITPTITVNIDSYTRCSVSPLAPSLYRIVTSGVVLTEALVWSHTSPRQPVIKNRTPLVMVWCWRELWGGGGIMAEIICCVAMVGEYVLGFYRIWYQIYLYMGLHDHLFFSSFTQSGFSSFDRMSPIVMSRSFFRIPNRNWSRVYSQAINFLTDMDFK